MMCVGGTEYLRLLPNFFFSLSLPPSLFSPFLSLPSPLLGKKLEEGFSLDKGLVSRGFGMLPTRFKSPMPHGVSEMKNGPPRALFDALAAVEKARANTTPRESFAGDGSGRPASPQEIAERGRQKAVKASAALNQDRRTKKESGGSMSRSPNRTSISPDGRAAGGGGETQARKARPMTAKQFRSSMY